MSRKRRFGLAEYKTAGRDYRDMYRATQAFEIAVGNAFPMRADLFKKARAATNAISELRSAIENACAEDFGDDEAMRVWAGLEREGARDA